MDNHTAPDLLEAVGVDWCNQPDMAKWRVGDGSLKSMRELHEGHYTYCLHHATYTGPALGTPELDALLLVAGQRWLTKQDTTTKMEIVEAIPRSSASTHQTLIWLMCHCDLPGHALARAIRETPHA